MPHPTVADSHFGNKEDITVTLNDPAKPSNPVAPDFVSQGKIFDAEAFGNGENKLSSSVKIVSNPSANPIKTIWVGSDKAGTFDIEVLLDESEIVGGQAVWRKITATPIAVVAGVLSEFSTTSLFRQVRINYTNDTAPAVVSAWAMSIA